MKNRKNLAIIIQNLVHYYTIKELIPKLKEEGYTYDLIVPFSVDPGSGFDDISNSTYEEIKSREENISRETKADYDVILEPYEMFGLKINSNYKIKYYYGLLSAKINWTFNLKNFIDYDAVFLYSEYEAELIKKMGVEVEVVPFIKYLKFSNNASKVLKNNKQTVLYLPTYGKESSLQKKSKELIRNLKDKYYVITKIHHGSQYLTEEKMSFKTIKELSDEFYGQEKDNIELFERADYVITDTSGVLFEAIFLEKPVAIFSPNVNLHRFNEKIPTFQQQIVDEFNIIYTFNVQEMRKEIDATINDNNYIKKIKKIKEKYFPSVKNPLDSYMTILSKYIKGTVSENVDFRKITNKEIKNDLEKLKKDNYIEKILKEKEVRITSLEEEKKLLLNEKDKFKDLYHQRISILMYNKIKKLFGGKK